MNRRFLPAIFSLLALSVSPAAGSRDLPECLWLIPTPNNVDSVMIDTCRDSPTYNQKFARYWFEVDFSSYVISLPQAPDSAIIDVGWEAIDMAYPEIRAGFEELARQYGPFFLRKKFPSNIDPSLAASRVYFLSFDNYAHVEGVVAHLHTLPGVGVIYLDRSFPSASANDREIAGGSDMRIDLFPNPAAGTVEISMHGAGEAPLSIIDISGRLMLTVPMQRNGNRSEGRADVSGLPNGIYFVGSGDQARSFVVRR